jgi:hypothetical protein
MADFSISRTRLRCENKLFEKQSEVKQKNRLKHVQHGGGF